MIIQLYLKDPMCYGNIAERTASCRNNNLLHLVLMWHLKPLFILLAVFSRPCLSCWLFFRDRVYFVGSKIGKVFLSKKEKRSITLKDHIKILTWDKLPKTAGPATNKASCFGLYLVVVLCVSEWKCGIAESWVGPLFLQSWFIAAMFKQAVVDRPGQKIRDLLAQSTCSLIAWLELGSFEFYFYWWASSS